MNHGPCNTLHSAARRSLPTARYPIDIPPPRPYNAPMSHTLIIDNLTFPAPPTRWTAGQPMTEIEAKILYQNYLENLRNNFASRVKRAKAQGLSQGTIADLRSAFAAYAANYEFSPDKKPRPSVDSAEAEALRLAKIEVRKQLAKKQIDPVSLPKGRIDQLAMDLVNKYPAFRDEARKRQEVITEVAFGGLDLLLG